MRIILAWIENLIMWPLWQIYKHLGSTARIILSKRLVKHLKSLIDIQKWKSAKVFWCNYNVHHNNAVVNKKCLIWPVGRVVRYLGWNSYNSNNEKKGFAKQNFNDTGTKILYFFSSLKNGIEIWLLDYMNEKMSN